MRSHAERNDGNIHVADSFHAKLNIFAVANNTTTYTAPLEIGIEKQFSVFLC